LLLNADRVASSTAFTARRWASLPLSEPLVKLLLAWRGQSKFNKDTEGLFANKLGLGAINLTRAGVGVELPASPATARVVGLSVLAALVLAVLASA